MEFNAKNQKFVKNMVETASPEQLVILLYDGTIQWLQMAKQEIVKQEENPPANWSNYSHYTNMAVNILTHLQESLDPDENSEFAEDLFALYDFYKQRIMKASIDKEPDILDEVIGFMKDLKITWQKALKQLQKPKTGAAY